MYYINVIEDFNLFDFIDENEINKVSFIEEDLDATSTRIKNILDNIDIADDEYIELFLMGDNDLTSLEFDLKNIQDNLTVAFSKNDEIRMEVLSGWDMGEEFLIEEFANPLAHLFSIYIKNEKSYTESIL